MKEVIALGAEANAIEDREGRIQLRRKERIRCAIQQELSARRLATCLMRALPAWPTESGIIAGPLFRRIGRHGTLGGTRPPVLAVALIVKRAVEAVRPDPACYTGQ